jgi:ABC-type antimicrobial peptide transport system permease subunit
MATVSDLAKLRIDRDAPPPAVKRALMRAVWLAAAAAGIVGAVALWLRGGSPTLVQVVTASLSDGGGAGGRGGASVGIVANGYVVARMPINGIVTSTTNWASFSEIAFSFRVTPGLLLSGFVFAIAMGLIGGFFPAWRAARLQVVQALR